MNIKHILGVLSVLAVSAFLIFNHSVKYSHQKAVLGNLEKLDLTGMEPQVAGKIQKMLNAVSEHPDSAEAWGKLAMNLDASDFNKESIIAYQEAAALDPTDFRWPYFCAISLSQAGSDESIQWFERAYKIKPDYVPLIINYGDVLFQHGKIDPAAEKYQEAIRYDAKTAHSYFGLAQIAFARGDLKMAHDQSQKAFESDSSFGEAYNLLATVCRRMNDANCAAQATAAAERLPKKSPLIDPVYAEVGAEGESSLWHRSRGSEYMKQKSYDTAIAEFQKALQIRSDVQTREDLAQALSAAGKYSEAMKQYESIVRDHPTAQNYFGLALACARMGSFDRAAEFFHKATDQDPNFAEAYFNLAVAYAKRGQLKETIESLQQAVRANPDYTEAHYHLALAYLQARDQKAALEEYRIVMKQNPSAGKQLESFFQQSGTE
jgi:tetratricopeptide (TPR) repeat protein